jgi:hypothetical protein
MVPAVAHAIEQIRADFPDSPITIREDGEGGAYMILEDVPLGPPYQQSSTWVGFRIVHQYPYADTYPHYVRGDLARLDGRPLGDGTTPTSWEGRPAIQLSRRSNRLDASTDTAALKLQKVLVWLLSRP